MKKSMLVFLVLVSLMNFVCADYLEQECIYQREGSHITFVYAGDLFGDGVKEIFAGSDNGQLMDFTYRDCRRQWTPAWSHLQKGEDKNKIMDVGVSNLDNDGKNDLVVAAYSRDDYLFVLSNEGFFRWSEEKAGGLVLSLDILDMDGDGLDEIIIGNGGNRVVVIDGEDDIKWVASLDNPVYFVKAVDVDNDGSMEVVALTNKYLNSAGVYVLDSNGSVIWNHPIYESIYQASEDTISIADLDGDGMQEIVVATYKEGVVALDYKGDLVWSYLTDKLVRSVHISDIDDDGKPEVLFGSNPYLYFLDSHGNLKDKTNINGSARIIQSADLAGGGYEDMVVGTNNMIKVIGRDGTIKGEWSLGKDVSTLSMQISDLDNDGKAEIIAGYGWEGARLDHGHKSGELIILKSTRIQETPTTVPTITTTPMPETTTTTVYSPPETGATTTTIKTTSTMPEIDDESGISWLTIILGVFAVGVVVFVLLAVIVFVFVMKKKKKNRSKDEETSVSKEEKIIEDIIEEKEHEVK